MAEGPDVELDSPSTLLSIDDFKTWPVKSSEVVMSSEEILEALQGIDLQRRRSHRRKLRKLRQRRALNPESINVYQRAGRLIVHLQGIVCLAVRNGCQKAIEIAADEVLKRWKYPLLDFDGFDDQNFSPLMRACEENKTDIVKVLLEKGATVAYKGKNHKGINSVHIACRNGNVAILQLLLTYAKEGKMTSSMMHIPDVNAKSTKSKESGWTPLMYAVKYGHLEAVKCMLGTGAVKLDVCTKKKMNVLHLAAFYQQLNCLKEIHSELESKAAHQTNSEYNSLYLAGDKKGWNTLHYACAGGSVGVMRWLLRNVHALRECLNEKSEKNYTPLLVACEYQKFEMVRYLLRKDQGARDMGVQNLGVDASASVVDEDFATQNVGRKTGLHLAAIHDSPEIAQELIAKGCPLDTQDHLGDTALHIARRKASLDVADILRRAPGGEQLTEIKNGQGKTPDQIQPEDVIPSEITKRGPKAEEAYRRALRKGKEKIPRCSLQILGEERVGKTSLLRSLTGKNFIEDLDSTRGIDNKLVDTLVDIRPICMAAWEEVNPQDQARKDDTLLVTGVIGELKKEGVLANQQTPREKMSRTKEPLEISEEKLLQRIKDAITAFEQPPEDPEPSPPQDVPPPQSEVPPHWATPMALPQPQPQPQPQLQPQPQPQPAPEPLPPELKPQIIPSKPKEKQKPVESHYPKTRRERAPNPTRPSPTPPSQQAVPTENRKEASRPSGTLISRRHHQSVDRMIKTPTAQQEPTLHLNTYDFAGQKQYRPMHHCFITRRALYLVVFNLQHMVEYLSDKGAAERNPLEEIRYWLNSIHAHIHIPTEDKTTKRVYLVGTHKAPKEGKQLKECDFEKIHDELEKVFGENSRILSHLCYTRDDRIFVAIENSLDGEEEREASGITTLQNELTNTCAELPFLKEQHPIIWLRFERGLLQLREGNRGRLPPLINLVKVQEMGQYYGIEEPVHALRFFHDNGTIILLKELSSIFSSEEEKNQFDSLVLLDPKWLIEVMKIIMELKMGEQKYRGKDLRDLKKKGIGNASLLRKCWEGCYSESVGFSFRQLCSILQTYCLIYPLQPHSVAPPRRSRSMPATSETTQQPLSRSQSEVDITLPMKFLVPCMLPSTPIPDDPIKKMTFSFDFKGFLPAEIFHRLICLMLAASAATRGRKMAPEFSATRCRFDNVEGRKWQLEMEPECHRLTVSVIPTQDEKLSRKPHSYISLFHHEFLQKICEKSDLQGLTYHGGPLLEKCATPECPWSGVLPFVSYPELEEPDYSPEVVCEQCNHEYDIDCLLKVTEPKEDRLQNTSEQQPQQSTINVQIETAIVATGAINIPEAALLSGSQRVPHQIALLPAATDSWPTTMTTTTIKTWSIFLLAMAQLHSRPQAQPTSNLQAQDPTMEFQSHGAIALPSTSHVGDNVPRSAASLAQPHTPQLEASLPILHEQAVPRLPVEELPGLHGVDIITETSISVTNKPQTFHWAGYGLKLHIPPASLPAGVGQSDIVIKASLAGQFRFPENTALVSAVYWLRCPVRFTKPLTLEIQHCAKHSRTLSFVRAKCSQKDLPYLFKPLASPRGVFSSDCGTVTLFSFSGLGIVQEGSEEQQYCARLYYIGNRIDWRVHFVVMKDLEAFITVVHQNYTEKGAIEGPDQDIEFEEDRITMEIPEGGSIAIGGWTITTLTPPMIIKKKVDSYKSGRRIPSCQFQVKWNKDQPPVNFQRRVILRGAKKSFNYITIQSDPLPSGKSPSPIRHVRDNILLNESHHSEITDYLVSIESEKKQLIDLGKKLGLRYSRLKRMTDSDNFLDDVIMSWLRKEDDVNEKCPPNWKNLVKVLTEIKQTGIAMHIEKDKSLQ